MSTLTFILQMVALKSNHKPNRKLGKHRKATKTSFPLVSQENK